MTSPRRPVSALRGFLDSESAGSLVLLAVAALCGVGFAMSLFIGLLAFAEPGVQDAVKLGVLAGSTLSGLLGWLALRAARPD